MSKYRDMAQAALPTQTERGDARQVQNAAGGYVYEVDKANRLRRFLVLGTEGGTFYASERDLTKTNLDFMKQFATEDPVAFYNVLADADANNIAPRHSTILLALAVLFSHTENVEIRDAVKAHFTQFVRTGTHLFEFVDYVTMYRKWGRGLRNLIASWYMTKEPDALAYQVVKYRQRGGWTHRDLLRKAHPKPADLGVKAVLDYVTKGRNEVPVGIKVIDQFEDVKAEVWDPVQADALTWEMLPTDSLTNRATWASLIAGGRLPYTAMVRNLGRMTSIGVFEDPVSLTLVVQRIKDTEQIKRARLHPFNALTALKTYQSGRGFRGSLTWTPKRQITDALDAAFYASFGTLESTGKRTLLALDVSGSMGSMLMNSNISAREGSVAMAMAMLAADPDTTDMVAFTSRGGRSYWNLSNTILTELTFSPRQRLDDIVRATDNLPFGGTDCALPFLWALEKGKVYDAVVTFTDSETWAGEVQVPEALRRYRAISPQARSVVVGMTSTGFTLADTNDPLCLDVVGFDSSAPRVISDFTAGRF